jgi:hypothetical protein
MSTRLTCPVPGTTFAANIVHANIVHANIFHANIFHANTFHEGPP